MQKKVITAQALRDQCAAVLVGAGSSPQEAAQVAANLVLANLSGHDSHGVGMIPRYVDAVLEKGLVPNTSAKVQLDAGSLLTLDGQRGYGQIVGVQAMEMAIKRANEIGSCILALGNAHHLGRIGHFAEMAVAQGLVSIHFVNVLSRPVVAPWGGGDGRFGTNPCCIGVPMAGREPFVLDFATSRVAQGKMRVAHNEGKKVPDGYLIDLEEDAGKSIHDESDGWAAGRADSEIDLNRTGTPLLEIVTQPDLRSSAEAKAFLLELKLLLTYIGVSDCNMQEGSLRVDGNINLHIDAGGDKVVATPIVEVKNMNSFRAVERALDYEAPRQYREWQETGKILGDAPKQTRGWDDAAGVTRPQRSKEESSDYRYFPDPDLVPITTTESEVAEVRDALPELPAALRHRLSADYELSHYDADVIVNQGRAVADYFIEVADVCEDNKAACNWVTQHVLRVLNDRDDLPIFRFEIPAAKLGEMIVAINDGRLPSTRGVEAFRLMIEKSLDVEAALAELKIERIDESALIALVEELLAANPKTVADIKAGKMQAAGALIGQAKKKNPNVDPNRVRELAIELAQKMDG